MFCDIAQTFNTCRQDEIPCQAVAHYWSLLVTNPPVKFGTLPPLPRLPLWFLITLTAACATPSTLAPPTSHAYCLKIQNWRLLYRTCTRQTLDALLLGTVLHLLDHYTLTANATITATTALLRQYSTWVTEVVSKPGLKEPVQSRIIS